MTSIKIDPYLNIDAGTMSPFEHGEVYTLEISVAAFFSTEAVRLEVLRATPHAS